jgi:hypothetical protein
VVAVEGFEHDALVAGVEQGHECAVHGAGRSAGDENVLMRIGGDAVEALELLRDGFAQGGDAVEAGVDVVAGPDGVDGCFDDRMGRVGVADALRHVDAVDLGAEDGHGPDLGLDEERSELAELQLGRRGDGDGHRQEARRVDCQRAS